MLQQEFGSVPLGYGAVAVCTNCNNSKPSLIYQDYVRSRGYVVVPLGTKYGGIFQFCHTCEKKTYLSKSGLFSFTKKSLEVVLSELDSGREYTLRWVSGLDQESREALFKRLNAIGAYQLVQFLGMPNR